MTLRRLASAATAAIACLAIATPATGTATTAGSARATTPAADETPGLLLVDQTFVVPGVETTAADGLSITLGGALLSPSPCNSPGDVLSVVAYRPVTTRRQAQAALTQPGQVVDRVELDACAITPLPNGNVQLDLATAPGAPADPAVVPAPLQLPDEGVIPIGVELQRGGSVVGRLVTFVDRLGDGDDASTPVSRRMQMQVAVAIAVDGGPTLQPDGTVEVSSADQAAVAALVDLLERVGDAPVSISIRPELLEGLSATGSAVVPDLRTAVAGPNIDVLAVPYVDMDPTAAAQAALGDTFATQLALGDQVLSQRLRRAPSRAVWFVPQSIGTDGAQLLFNAGVRLAALLPPASFSFSPSDRQFLIPLPTGSLAATPVDHDIAAALADPGPDPTLAAYHLAAQVLLMRHEALDPEQGYAPMEDHNMILSTPDGSLGDPETTATLIALLGEAPQLSLVTASTIGQIAHPIMTERGPYEEPPPAAEFADLTPLRDDLAAANADVEATSSMLPDGDPRPAAWRSIVDVMPAATLTDGQRAAYAEAVAASTGAVRADVVPPPSRRFTLGGRHATLRLSLRNDGDTDLTVRLIVDSSKLEIDDPNRLVLLPAGQTEEVAIPVDARTNGEFPVDVRLTTPEGDVDVTEPVVMTARVNALTGLGQLATGGFVLVLLTWWVHHLRQRRREAAAAAAAVTP